MTGRHSDFQNSGLSKGNTHENSNKDITALIDPPNAKTRSKVNSKEGGKSAEEQANENAIIAPLDSALLDSSALSPQLE